MEVETVAADGEFKMPKKALKRKIAEAEKVTSQFLTPVKILPTFMLVLQEAVMDTESGVSDVDSVVSGTTAPLRPAFPPIKREKLADGSEVFSITSSNLSPVTMICSPKVRKIPVPSHRYTPLKENWMKIFEPIVEHLKLQVGSLCYLRLEIIRDYFRSGST